MISRWRSSGLGTLRRMKKSKSPREILRSAMRTGRPTERASRSRQIRRRAWMTSSLATAWVLDVASGKQRKLVETADPTQTARWSPDGKSIAYLSSAGLVVYQVNLFVVDANGGSPRKLSGKFELNAGEPIWSRDGKTIFFSSDDHEANKIFAVDVAAGTIRPLTDAATRGQVWRKSARMGKRRLGRGAMRRIRMKCFAAT